MHVHANDDLAARAADALVESRRLDAPGVVDEPDAPVGGGEAPEHLARRVHAHPVGDQDLESIAGPVLRQDRLDAGLDVRLFVEARNRDGHEGLHPTSIRPRARVPAGDLCRIGRCSAALVPVDLRVLLVSYSFPPVGGAGVQRVVKLAKYLPHHGVWPAILTAANPERSAP